MIPNSAWKDYSANTNYGYENRETEEKNGATGANGKRSRSTGSQQTTLPMSHSPSKTQYYEAGRNGRHQNGNGQNGEARWDFDGKLINAQTDNSSLVCRYTNGNGMHNGDGYGGYPGGRPSYADRTYSLPRTVIQHQQQQQQQLQHQNAYGTQGHPGGGYYTTDRRSRSHQQPSGGGGGAANGTDTPDFYFMPSQRKYSGEVVRVYVDYNKEPKD